MRKDKLESQNNIISINESFLDKFNEKKDKYYFGKQKK